MLTTPVLDPSSVTSREFARIIGADSEPAAMQRMRAKDQMRRSVRIGLTVRRPIALPRGGPAAFTEEGCGQFRLRSVIAGGARQRTGGSCQQNQQDQSCSAPKKFLGPALHLIMPGQVKTPAWLSLRVPPGQQRELAHFSRFWKIIAATTILSLCKCPKPVQISD
jgi:hypothetical protein